MKNIYRNSIKIFLLSALLLVSNVESLYANDYITPTSIRCQPYTSYNEKSVVISQSEQFSHIAY